MNISVNNFNNKQSTFKASFLKSDSLKSVVEYAVEHNKFDKLNEARKIIESRDKFTKILLNCGYDEKKHLSFIEITRFRPTYTLEDGVVKKSISERTSKKYYAGKNPLKVAYEKIIKLSNNFPKNNVYKFFVR